MSAIMIALIDLKWYNVHIHTFQTYYEENNEVDPIQDHSETAEGQGGVPKNAESLVHRFLRQMREVVTERPEAKEKRELRQRLAANGFKGKKKWGVFPPSETDPMCGLIEFSLREVPPTAQQLVRSGDHCIQIGKLDWAFVAYAAARSPEKLTELAAMLQRTGKIAEADECIRVADQELLRKAMKQAGDHPQAHRR